MSTPEEQLFNMIVARFDRIENLLENKVDYRAFTEFKKETADDISAIREDIDELKEAAITPDQVTNMIGTKLQESSARGVTAKERGARYLVAAVVVLTFLLQIAQEVFR